MHDSLIEEFAAGLAPRQRKDGRAVVLGIDGVPFTLIKELVAQGRLPRIAGLIAKGTLAQMQSTLPCVSSVAWTSFRTGVNPGHHGVTGFTDRKPGSYKVYFPTTSALPLPTFEEHADRMGKKVLVIGMPLNYPPVKLKNGISVGCFLSPSLEKAIHPPEILDQLKEISYRIDVDARLAPVDPAGFVEDVFRTTHGYRDLLFKLWEREKWDLIMVHLMSTDRLHHFMWDQFEDSSAPHHGDFLRLYSLIDEIVGDVAARLDDDTMLMMLSDHGFCTIKWEVNTNVWLQQEGFLKFQGRQPRSLEEIDGRSEAYSLIPGRFYVNLKGREPRGSVAPGKQYDQVRCRLADRLLSLKDPNSGESVVERVEFRENLYGPGVAGVAPDVIAVARYGYDLKDRISATELFSHSHIKGMHTYDDAFLYVNRDLPISGLKIWEAAEIYGRQCGCRTARGSILGYA
jgi:predicted AlkP superfamily phosphohydrolase/phosphomutase